METINQKSFSQFFLVFIFFLVGFFLINQSSENFLINSKPENIKYITIAEQTISVELALSTAELARGLSGHKALDVDEGMLFVFPEPGNYPFWMKDMNFAIDIIWLSEYNRVIYIKSYARPELFPETYGPDKNQPDAKYVLEVLAGFSEKSNLRVGDRVEFIY